MGFFSVTFVVHCQFISHLKAKARYHHMRVTDVGLHHYLAKARNSRWPSDCATCTLAANWPHHWFGHDVIGTLPWPRTRHTPELVTGKPEGREKKKKMEKKKKRAIPVVKYFLCYGLPQDTTVALLLIPPTIHLTLHLFPSPTPHHTPHPSHFIKLL